MSALAPSAPTPTTAPASALPDSASVTALLTSLFAGTRLAMSQDATSARAAYQDALYGRCVLVDLRPPAARLAAGDLDVGAVTFSADHGSAISAVRHLAENGPVALVSSDGVLAARVAQNLRALGLTWVDAVAGGFDAWRSAGLPITGSRTARCSVA